MNASRLLSPSAFLLYVLIGGIVLLGSVFFHLLRHDPRRSEMAGRWTVTGGNYQDGKESLQRYGCASCHVIPGLRSALGEVGPSLEQLRSQIFIAGVLPNSPENMVRWIVNPQMIDPHSAMPNLGVKPEEARHMAQYLYMESR